MMCLAPLAYPMSKALDYIVGHDESHMNKTLIVAILKNQNSILSKEEIKMSTGAIGLMKRKVITILIRKVFSLNENDIFTKGKVELIQTKGYSRIPIYNTKKQCTKILITKSILFAEKYYGKRIIDCPFTFITPIPISSQNNAYQALARMKKFHTSILLVVNKSIQVTNTQANNNVIHFY